MSLTSLIQLIKLQLFINPTQFIQQPMGIYNKAIHFVYLLTEVTTIKGGQKDILQWQDQHLRNIFGYSFATYISPALKNQLRYIKTKRLDDNIAFFSFVCYDQEKNVNVLLTQYLKYECFKKQLVNLI